MINCEECQKPFKPTRTKLHMTRFCSRDCSNLHNSRNRRTAKFPASMTHAQAKNRKNMTSSEKLAASIFLDQYVPGKKLARQAWNKSIKLGDEHEG